MTVALMVFSLAFSAANWVLFAWSILAKTNSKGALQMGMENVELQGVDLGKTLESTGKLVHAFKDAGAPATAAALSLIGLIVAAIAAGINKL